MILGQTRGGEVSGQDVIDDRIIFHPMSPPARLLCNSRGKHELVQTAPLPGLPLIAGNERAVLQHFGLSAV